MQEIRDYRKARNLRLEHSTARSLERGPRRYKYTSMMDEVSTATGTTSVKTTSAQRRSGVNHVGARLLPIQKMARKAEEEQKAAELKNEVQTVKKSLKVQQTGQQYQAAEEARAIAAREAAVETSREGGCRERGESSITNKAEGLKPRPPQRQRT